MLVNQPMPSAPPVAVPLAPWALSGTVLGVLMNHRPALAALGDAVHQPPYKAPPKAPVLYVKPRNTWLASGGTVVLPAGEPELVFGATLAAVIGRPAKAVAAADALDHVAGWLLVGDVFLPHEVYYRPSLRWRVRDGFCPLGAAVVARSALPDPDALTLTVAIDGQVVHQADTGERVRDAATLIADVSEFMTLNPGDVLMTGVAHGAPRVRAGQRVRVSAPGLADLQASFVAEAA
jgi:5-oxopent-3-ene-1,2,5-tricarboxylate decarboxylase/2-hydroxyhepta-2,4-diene-1,7-dioate isomerase